MFQLHRNTYSDDGIGVGEALNEYLFGEEAVVRGSHYLIAGSAVDEVEGNGLRGMVEIMIVTCFSKSLEDTSKAVS